MTDIDTAAIRASWRYLKNLDARRDIEALCDALDVARAERDEHKMREQRRLTDWLEQRDRADTAVVQRNNARAAIRFLQEQFEEESVTSSNMARRAEAAEAELARVAEGLPETAYRHWRARAEATEARIAAALAECDRDTGSELVAKEFIRRALTGGTDQVIADRLRYGDSL